MAEAWKKDPEFQAAYDELETDFALLRELLAARRRAGLTQARYMEYLEALKDPSHPDHQQMVEWRGPSFDPERFDPGRINRRLSLLSRRRRRA